MNIKNKIIPLFIVITLLFTGLYIIIPRQEPEKNIEYFTRTAQKFSEEIQAQWDTDEKYAYYNFKSFKDGDIVRINDSIDFISYEDRLDYTSIQFMVNTNLPEGGHMNTVEFNIQGDITDEYSRNNRVEISFTIKHDVFSYNNWTYDVEVFKEAYNKQFYLENNYLQILPKSSIKHLSI